MIEELLNKYFEGETSAAEEAQLRAFFSSDNIPEHLAVYKPMFAYFSEEISKEQAKKTEAGPTLIVPKTRKVFYWVAGIAASLLIVLGIGQLWFFPGSTFCSDNYVVINGRCYTDKQMIRSHAFEALQEVSTSEEEILPLVDDEDADRSFFENHLQELNSLFSENE